MAEKIQVKLAEVSELIISIQNQDATLFDYLVEIDESKFEQFKQIQLNFQKMQSELFDLVNQA